MTSISWLAEFTLLFFSFLLKKTNKFNRDQCWNVHLNETKQGDGIVDDSSLLEIGVLDSEHRRQLVNAAILLKTPLQKMNSVARPETVDEWLHLLRLNHYGQQFHKNRYDDMERVARIWEVELTTVVEIRLVGHLRRMLVSLGNGAQQRPSKLCNGAVPHPANSGKINNQDDLTAMSSDLKLIVSCLSFFYQGVIRANLLANSIIHLLKCSRRIWPGWRTRSVRK